MKWQLISSPLSDDDVDYLSREMEKVLTGKHLNAHKLRCKVFYNEDTRDYTFVLFYDRQHLGNIQFDEMTNLQKLVSLIVEKLRSINC